MWREGWSRGGEAPISSLAGRAISPTPGNGHVQPHWRGLAWSPATALAVALLRARALTMWLGGGGMGKRLGTLGRVSGWGWRPAQAKGMCSGWKGAF